MPSAKLKCPECGFTEELEIPKNKCLAFYKCKKCSHLMRAGEGACCVICAYSDKKCEVSTK